MLWPDAAAIACRLIPLATSTYWLSPFEGMRSRLPPVTAATASGVLATPTVFTVKPRLAKNPSCSATFIVASKSTFGNCCTRTVPRLPAAAEPGALDAGAEGAAALETGAAAADDAAADDGAAAAADVGAAAADVAGADEFFELEHAARVPAASTATVIETPAG